MDLILGPDRLSRPSPIDEHDFYLGIFLGVRFGEVDGDVLFVYAQNEELAAEMEDRFALHISIVATGILKREIGAVIVMPKQLAD
jgi:hypothetical protein